MRACVRACVYLTSSKRVWQGSQLPISHLFWGPTKHSWTFSGILETISLIILYSMHDGPVTSCIDVVCITNNTNIIYHSYEAMLFILLVEPLQIIPFIRISHFTNYLTGAITNLTQRILMAGKLNTSYPDGGKT